MKAIYEISLTEQIRRSLGLTRKQLAKELGVCAMTITLNESKTHKPSIMLKKALINIANKHGLEILESDFV